MYDENEELVDDGQQNQENPISKAQARNQRNVANNAQIVRNAADIAAKSNNAYAKAIGTGVKAIDKMSSGKASEALGKTVNTANKLNPSGWMTQKALNKFAESGAASRLTEAMNKKNSNSNNALKNKNVSSSKNEAKDHSKRNESQENSSQEASGEFSVSIEKVLKIALILSPVLVIVAFCCLLVSGAYVLRNANLLDLAGISLSPEEAEDRVENVLKDEDALVNDENNVVGYDIYISDSKAELLKKSKLQNNSIIQIVSTEELIEKIEDLFPAVNNLSKNYDEKMVYRFFYKLYKLYNHYNTKYKVKLDLPLILATLNLQSTDGYVVFSSNLSPQDNNLLNNGVTEYFDYYYDWSKYEISINNSQHDMELLAKNMVSVDESGNCYNKAEDGKCYVKDDEQYKEFLKEFLEKKYVLDDKLVIENGNISSIPSNGEYKNWTQCNQSWSSIIVPNSNSTICKIGCLLTSVSIQIARSGTAVLTETFNPGIAAQNFSFTKGGYFLWNSTTNIAPNFQHYAEINLRLLSKAKIVEKLNSYDPSRYYIILAVSPKHSLKITHYVALDYIDSSNNKIYMMDPAAVNDDDLFEKYKVYQANIYEKRD